MFKFLKKRKNCNDNNSIKKEIEKLDEIQAMLLKQGDKIANEYYKKGCKGTF